MDGTTCFYLLFLQQSRDEDGECFSHKLLVTLKGEHASSKSSYVSSHHKTRGVVVVAFGAVGLTTRALVILLIILLANIPQRNSKSLITNKHGHIILQILSNDIGSD